MDLTKEEFKAILIECLYKLESLGPEFSIDNDVKVDLSFFESTGTLGECGIRPIGDGKFIHIVKFNKYLLHQSLKDLIINNIYHEFCHYFQNKEAVRAGYYYYNEDGVPMVVDDSDAYDYFHGDDAGHSECWFKYVDKVNEVLKPAIPVTAHPDDESFNFYISQNDALFSIKCERCGTETKFLSYNEYDYSALPTGLLSRLATDEANNVTNDFCACGGCLRLHTKDKQTLYNILDKERERMLDEMLAKLKASE